MITIFRKGLLVFLIAFGIVVPRESIADVPPRLPSELISALLDLKDVFGKFDKAQRAANEALSGRTITFDDNWKDLATAWEAAATKLESSPLPSQFKSDNTISLSDLTNCVTFQSAITKLRNYLSELRRAQTEEESALKQIGEFESEIPATKKTIAILETELPKLRAVPIYGELFELLVLDLNTKIPRALGILQGALKKRHSLLDADRSRLSTAIGNFEANLNAVSKLPYSPICGSLEGRGESASAQFGGAPYCKYSVTLQNLALNANIDQSGKVTNASLSLTMVEGTVGGCSYPPIGTKSHTYSGGGSTNGNSITLQLNPAGGNVPRALATFTGQGVNGRLIGSLTVQRNDIGGNLAWTVPVQIK